MKTINKIIIAASFSLTTAQINAATNVLPNEFQIEVDQPTFVLPQFSGPFREREATVAPEELETAERLRSMLDQGKKQAVLKELETFYDIELSVAMIMLKAQLYFALEEYSKAEKAYQVALNRSPQLVRAHSDLGQLYLIQKQYKKARSYFARAVALGANDAVIHGQLAYLNLTQFGAYAAISAYQQALAIEPEREQWQQGLFVALTEAKMYQAAEALLSDLIAKSPNKSSLWLNQAVLKLEQNDSLGALSALELAILLGDNRESNLKTAAQLHLQLDSFDRAVELINTHLSNYKLDLASLNTYLTWLSQRGLNSQSQHIIDTLETKFATFDNKTKSVILLHRAKISQENQQLESAKKDFQQALNFNPNHGEMLIAYADFLASQKQFTQAETLLLRAEALDKTQKQAMLSRAQMYVDLQNFAAALSVLKSVATRYPSTQGIRQQIDILENILITKAQHTQS